MPTTYWVVSWIILTEIWIFVESFESEAKDEQRIYQIESNKYKFQNLKGNWTDFESIAKDEQRIYQIESNKFKFQNLKGNWTNFEFTAKNGQRI